jgi:hypothetical protein
VNVVRAWSRRDRILAGAIVGVGSLVIATAGGVVVAGAASAPDVFTGCLDHKTHTIYKVAANAKSLPKCRAGDRRMKWNSRGPQGLRGAQGLRGLQGLTGAAGPSTLTALQGTPCTTTEGPAGTVAVSIDSDNAIRLTCHSTTVVPIGITTKSAQALADRLFTHPTGPTLPVPAQCNGSFQTSCSGGTPSDPLPTVTVDQTEHVGDTPRAAGTAVPASNRFDLTGTFRLASDTDIPITVNGLACSLAIDTAPGTTQDVTQTLQDSVVGGSPNGPTTVANSALTGLEAVDFTIGGGPTCEALSISPSQISSLLADMLDTWLGQVALLCGATAPDYFQVCH